MRPLARFALLLALGAAGAGCTSDRTEQPLPAAAAPQTPQRFVRITRDIRAALADASRSDAQAVRARGPAISNEGLALIKAVLPHDVSRTDVPRYLEGRAVFGDALKAWVVAVESGTDAQLFGALYRLDGATRGWIDAYLGLEPETSV